MANKAQRTDPRPFARAPYRLHGFLSVASLNVGSGPASAVMHSLIEARDMGFLVIGVQEGGDRELILRQFCSRYGYNIWLGDPDKPGASSTPILYDKQLRIMGRGTRLGSRRQNAGNEGAGPDIVKQKVINYLKIRGGWVVTNTHMPASATYAEGRREPYREYMDNLMEFLSTVRDAYVVNVGDYNAADKFYLLGPLRKWGRDVVVGDTHKHGSFDKIWINGRVIPIAVWKANVRSDHDLVGGLFAKKGAFQRARS